MPRVRRCRQQGCHLMVEYPNHYCRRHFEHEAEYLASRQKWARSRDQQYQRKYNTVTRNRSEHKSKQYNFYRSRQWSRLRRNILERDNYLCKYCGAINIVTPAKTVDHIVPIEYDAGLRDDPNNLAVICYSCHRSKTDWEQIYYGTGQGNTLKKVPEIKNINQVIRHMKTLSPESS
ncbi:HNH endonuclease [Ligilactobacillus murinus]|uniref:Putative HNH nuclease YajD n=1 Tax=Ligilactobacillus murinus TaxID=1622 RepID=A0AAE7BQR1_9LACO|nr:HNH endonuclease [Ligilactobacillus murinus]NEF83610.1 HNH endonuclease [Ligilactobacillus murinus]NEF85893.1 HNH endonuclease [Ligilactobacillus murinus]NEF88167.1 HNH endonuclease [Ligilactobacillus murinus]NEF90462.1 HNH endonuclease [Ligilactobacillus murinus]NEF92702.1 HNH endonuclease [Ligilactobacillus murinus]